MKGGSIKLPVGERETDKSENGSIYRWAFFSYYWNVIKGLWQKPLQWHAAAKITFNGVFIISIKTTLIVPTESSTNVQCWEIWFHQKTQSVMCTCVFSDKAEKILGRQGQNHWLMLMFDWNYLEYHFCQLFILDKVRIVEEDYSWKSLYLGSEG